MDDLHRPRHIRDIAHLYLSKSKAPRNVEFITLFVAGQTRRCIPALHAANLAVALSMRKAAVLVTELSGILPSVSFYFSHPPDIHVGGAAHTMGNRIPAAPNVWVTFDGFSGGRVPCTAGRSEVNLVHLPPLEFEGEVQHCINRFQPHHGGTSCALIVAENGAVAVSPFSSLSSEHTFVLDVGDDGTATPVEPVRCLGRLRGWERSMVDRMPVCTRNPHSALAATYLGVCDHLLGQIQTTRRYRESQRTAGDVPSRAIR